MRAKTVQREDAGERIERRCKNSEWQRADERQHVTGEVVVDVDLREGDKAAVGIVYVAVGIGDGDRGTVVGDLCPIVVAPRRRIVGIEIEVRRVEITGRRVDGGNPSLSVQLAALLMRGNSWGGDPSIGPA
jgi:hypothetical protein